MIRFSGNSKPELSSAERTRSRDSRTEASGSPTIAKPGRPGVTSSSTWTASASIADEGEGSGHGEHAGDARRGAARAWCADRARIVPLPIAIRATRVPRGAQPRGMTAARQRLGRAAEDLVARRLAAQGWRVVERNARTRTGELDLIALDGTTLVFVEVKAEREGSRFGPVAPRLTRSARASRPASGAWPGSG